MQTTSTLARQTPMTWTPWVNVAVGVAAIITPFVGGEASDAFRVSNVITGIIIVIVALIAFASSQSRSGLNVAVVNIVAGIWLLISTAFTLHAMLVWENVVLGVLAILTAAVAIRTHTQIERLMWLRSRPDGS